MAIVSSQYTTDATTQRSGARWVVERHTDNTGKVHLIGPYLWDGVADRDALLSRHADEITLQLGLVECNYTLSVPAQFGSLVHSTKTKLAELFWTRVNESWVSGDKLESCRLVWWAYQRIQDGSITSDQLRQSYNAFFSKSLNSTQWGTLVTSRFLPMRDRYQAILDEGTF